MEKWNEICFILKGSLPSNISEQLYESKVVQAFEKIGWSQYKGEISVRETIPFGAANRMNPDVIIKTIEKENLFVVEIKKPSANVDYHGFEDQLSSYMRMLKLNVGVLIGSKIKIYVDGSLVNSQRLILIDEIDFTEDNDEGLNFINVFGKAGNSSKKINNYIQKKIKSIKFNNTKSKLLQEMLSADVEIDIKDMIRSFYTKVYDKGIVDEVLNEVSIEIHSKKSKTNDGTISSFSDLTQIKDFASKKMSSSDDLIAKEIQKIERKIPKWFNNPSQINSRILIAFMEILDSKKSVTYNKLEQKCKSIKSFKSNFDQMSMFGEKNHGKVFEKTNSLITLWQPVNSLIDREYMNYKNKKH